MVIGVTGRYAAGKDEVSRLLSPYGYPEINVDALGHQALEEKHDEVLRLFGRAVLGVNNMIDRRSLGRIVFGNPEAMAQLEAVLHPHIKNMVEGAAHSCGGRCVINAAVLFPMGLDSLTDLVIIVRAPFFTRYRRARSRDDLGMKAFLARCRSQRKIVPKFKPGNVDIQVIWNTRNLTYLKTQVDALMLRYAPAQTKDAPP